MVYDSARGQIVLFGGAEGSNGPYFNDTWVWDGVDWTQKSPRNSPTVRSNGAMVYDSIHRQVVLFGGYSIYRELNDTWVWDGADWTQKLPQASPLARYNHSMALDSLGKVVLFGGGHPGFPLFVDLDDTWTWDGSNWTQKTPQTSPPAQSSKAMAYDSARSQAVLFGGTRTAPHQTWIWDGSNWTQKLPKSSPSAIGDHAMAYDSAHGQVVLFGGTGTFLKEINDTWTWDGTDWTQKSPQNSPPARSQHAMAYDPAHAQVVLFGGDTVKQLLFGDTWVWEGGKAPQINSGGIVNNASYTLGSAGSSVAPGSIAAIFGSNLTDGTSCLPPTCNPTFGNGKLNTSMSGAQVTVGGTPVPIFYATPTQLGIQIPFELAGTSASVVVSVAGQSSASATVTVAPVSPGIFTYTADGKGAGAITHADGSAVTAQSPAGPGEIVILYATGLGQVAPAVATGALPAGASTTVSPVMLAFGGIGVIPDYAGLSGCCVGLNQINARVPAGVTLGNAVPVVLNISGQSSNTATIAVQYNKIGSAGVRQ